MRIYGMKCLRDPEGPWAMSFVYCDTEHTGRGCRIATSQLSIHANVAIGEQVLKMSAGTVAEDWHHDMASRFVGLEVEAVGVSSELARGSVSSTDLGGVKIFGISGSPQRLVRSAATARRLPAESLKVCAVRRGRGVIEQSGHQVVVGPGEFTVYDTSLPYRITWPDSFECDVMTAPAAAAGVQVASLTGVEARTWSTRTGTGAMLLRFMKDCAAMPAPSAVAREHLGSAGVSLLTGVLLSDFEPVAEDAGELFHRQVEAYVARFLRDPRLDLAAIAAAHRVSVRTLQRTFAGTGRGLSGLIRLRRLEAVRRDLIDPRLAHLTIAEIAAAWCLHDAQWLAKAFKAEFDVSPSEFRRS